MMQKFSNKKKMDAKLNGGHVCLNEKRPDRVMSVVQNEASFSLLKILDFKYCSIFIYI